MVNTDRSEYAQDLDIEGSLGYPEDLSPMLITVASSSKGKGTKTDLIILPNAIEMANNCIHA